VGDTSREFSAMHVLTFYFAVLFIVDCGQQERVNPHEDQ